MDAESLQSKVVLTGTTTSPSGYRVATEIEREVKESRSWPYFTITITGHEGTPLYRSPRRAAWFPVHLCWDGEDRLWVASEDSGTDVLTSSPEGWIRHRWQASGGPDSVLDVESGERLPVVRWEPPPSLPPLSGR